MILYGTLFYGTLSEKLLVSEIVTIFYIDCNKCIKMTTHITKKVPCFRAGANAISNKVSLVLYLDKEIIRESKDLGFNLSRTFENHETFDKEHVIILGNFYLYFLNSSKFRILFSDFLYRL